MCILFFILIWWLYILWIMICYNMIPFWHILVFWKLEKLKPSFLISCYIVLLVWLHHINYPSTCLNPNRTSSRWHVIYSRVDELVTRRGKRTSIQIPFLLSVPLVTFSSFPLPLTTGNYVLPDILTPALSYHIYTSRSFFRSFFSFFFNLYLNFCFSYFSIPSIHNAHWCHTLHHRLLRSKISIL